MTRALLLVAALSAAGACAPSATGDPKPAAASAAAASPGATPAAQAGGSLRLTLRLSAGGPEILSRAVSDAPVQRRDPYRNEPTFFRVYDGAGRALTERGFKLVTALRSEVPAADGTLSGEHVPIETPIVSIQVPRFPDAAVIRLYRRDATAPNAAPELLAEVKP
jgi:hypothetical protein